MKQQTNIYYTQTFFAQLFFWCVFTINILYYVKIVDMNALQLIIIGTILECTIFLFEIPTGLIADLKGRKVSIILGYGLIGSGFLLEALFPVFIAIVASQVLWGIGYTCISGATQAWITDEVGIAHIDKIFLINTQAENIGTCSGIIIAIACSFVSLQFSILIGGIGFVLLAIYVYVFLQEQRQLTISPTSLTYPVWLVIKEVAGSVKKSVLLQYCLWIALIVGCYSEALDRLWILHLQHLLPTALTHKQYIVLIGGLQLAISISVICLFTIFSKFEYPWKAQQLFKVIQGCYALLIVMMLLFTLANELFLLVGSFFILQVTRQTLGTFEQIWFNQIIPENSNRATFLSVKSQMDAFGQIGGGPVTGILSQLTSVKIGLLCSAILLSPVLYLYNKIRLKS
ncbi:MFS transporter [Lysinibacillus piscis]|uniref:Tetracycline efflux MFS transporter TetA(P) n=1 Tax=Lysinibacillus piscis TaxID=2518931 RepID=A0ABQ5NMY1_9BACI|nr:MFS transporter [Lysinibacillus sp. KH24]GLC89600.1 tetracycline efflux MFS transporter TetA(P) [Lysinibacillus sp. KH24]